MLCLLYKLRLLADASLLTWQRGHPAGLWWVMATVRLQHVAAGCNRVCNALHWGDNGLVAYASHHAVIVYDLEAAAVLGTIVGHGDCVNCVRWFSAADWGLPAHAAGGAPALLAAGCGDGAVSLWLWLPASPEAPWRLAARLAGHAGPVTSLATHRDPAGGVVLASTAGDGDVLVWQGAGGGPEAAAGEAAWQLRQRLSLGPRLQHCAALAALPHSAGALVLALGGVDASVRLLSRVPGGDFGGGVTLAGHQDWVRGLAFTETPDGRLLLASASQDKYIRVWAVAPEGEGARSAGAGGSAADEIARYAPRPQLLAGASAYSATLEALLMGHEDWVQSVAWQPGGGAGGAPALLSASMDHTMMTWRPDKATGLWLSEAAVGEAGPNHLGYFTGAFSPDGRAILAHGFTGALHLWRRQPGGGWAPGRAPGGHWGPVVDATWAVDGGCLLTVGTDQTARISAELAGGGGWCEIARTQVHGHDFSCVAALPPGTTGAAANGGGGARPRAVVYASASEEKVIRVFEEPGAFSLTLDMARGRAVDSGAQPGQGVVGASLPALGLSNKAIFSGDGGGGAGGADDGATGAAAYTDGPDIAPAAAPAAVAGPPLEEHLSQNTLWPEVHKLYGHGNELYCLAADPRGAFLASACRAQSAAAAEVWLWDTRTWTPAGALPAHTLTVTQLAFSPCGAYLASASRDRTVALFARAADGAAGGPPFQLLARVKAHARIVWGLHWAPDAALLATASRDGSVKLWAVERLAAGAGAAQAPAPLATVELGDSVRSVAFAPAVDPGSYVLAAGLERGTIVLLRVALSGDGAEVSELWRSSQFVQHAAAVRRLCWRAAGGEQGGEGGQPAGSPQQPFLLASCGDDHAVRVLSVDLG